MLHAFDNQDTVGSHGQGSSRQHLLLEQAAVVVGVASVFQNQAKRLLRASTLA